MTSPRLDPVDDPPFVTCPDCGGDGGVANATCDRCGGEGEAFMTDEEVRDARAEAQVERAEAWRDGDL